MDRLFASLADLAAFYSSSAGLIAIWTLVPAALIAAGVTWAYKPNVIGRQPLAADAPVAASRRAAIVAASVLAAYLTAYSLLVFHKEDLVGADFSQLTAQRFFAMPIWTRNGRFFPFGLQEYNVISAVFGRSAAHYHVFSILQLVGVLASLAVILRRTPTWYRVAVMVIVTSATSFVVPFFGIVYPERDLVFWIAAFIACYLAFLESGRRRYFAGSMIAAQFALYYKEPAFLFIGGFAGVRLVIQALASPELRAHRYAEFARRHWSEIALLTLAAIFVVLYLVLIVPHIETSYAGTPRAGGAWFALTMYARTDFILVAFGIVFALRMLACIRARRLPDSFWDALACGAILYGLAIVKLQLVREQYMSPVDFVGILYMARVAYDVLVNARRSIVFACVAAVGLIAWQNLHDSASFLVNRKLFVDANAQIVRFLRATTTDLQPARIRLYFPQVAGFQLMEFSAFLEYKGLHVLGEHDAEATGRPAFIVTGPHRYPNDQCFESQAFRCGYSAAPESGDLILFLPGREKSATELAVWRKNSDAIFTYRPSLSAVDRVLMRLASIDETSIAWSNAYVFRH